MKKRILSILLAAVLVFGLFVLPAQAATPANVYSYFANYLKNYGTADGSSYYEAYYIDTNYTVAFQMEYIPSAYKVNFYVFAPGEFDVCMTVTSSGATPYAGYIKYFDVASGNFSIYPSSYTGNTAPTLYGYSGNTSVRSELAELAREALNIMLEFINIEMWDAGYRLKDLGFTQFTMHTVHYYNDGVVTTQPTCVNEGVRTYTCKICGGATFTESVPTVDHTWKIAEPPADPNDIHGTATYACVNCGTTTRDRYCGSMIFEDMPMDNEYSHWPIDWAFFNGITTGTSATRFSPDSTCTRAQVVTFLWRAAGEPEPTMTENPFEDVAEGQYYYKPVLWAVEKGITTGTSETRFSPDSTCLRAQIVTFLWRAAGEPESTEISYEFTDVSPEAYYYTAMLWAVESRITLGTSATKFSPDNICIRQQVVTFLYRYMVEN